MFALANGIRNALLVAGPCVFQHGNAAQIGHYTAGMQDLNTLLKRLEDWSGQGGGPLCSTRHSCSDVWDKAALRC